MDDAPHTTNLPGAILFVLALCLLIGAMVLMAQIGVDPRPFLSVVGLGLIVSMLILMFWPKQ